MKAYRISGKVKLQRNDSQVLHFTRYVDGIFVAATAEAAIEAARHYFFEKSSQEFVTNHCTFLGDVCGIVK